MIVPVAVRSSSVESRLAPIAATSCVMVTLPPVVEKEKASWSSIFSMIPLAVAVLPEKTRGVGLLALP